MPTTVLWLRRDLRLSDHAALLAAATQAGPGGEVLPLFVLDDVLRGPSGPARLAFLHGCLRELERRTDGALRVVAGDPVEVVPRVARAAGAEAVHISSDHGPYGRRRDQAVATALGDVPLVATGSPYGVTPGTLTKGDGLPYKVFTPFSRAWRARGLRSPATLPAPVRWTDGGLPHDGVPDDPDLGSTTIPVPGELAALERWEAFRATALDDYADLRNTPGVEGTSRLSTALKYGCLHPRTLHAALGDSPGHTVFGTELIWRDFYADVLWHLPGSARSDLTTALQHLEHDDGPVAQERFAAWCEGRTGFPFVDAGMRQLLGEGWVHNRVRMVVASFLTKDLHLRWTWGARHFMRHLVDGDLASNQHGWQWTAGTGTDAAPYFRVFNPVTQGRTFDPDGDYVRRWVPELRGVTGKAVHEPWTLPTPPADYPRPIVDHAEERRETLRRYELARR